MALDAISSYEIYSFTEICPSRELVPRRILTQVHRLGISLTSPVNPFATFYSVQVPGSRYLRASVWGFFWRGGSGSEAQTEVMCPESRLRYAYSNSGISARNLGDTLI